jgi:hypothetical protein
MHRRTLLTTVAAILSGFTAGCSTTDDRTNADAERSTTSGASTTTTRRTATATTTREPHPSNVPEPNHEVLLWNDDDEPHTLALAVQSRQRTDVVHQGTYEVAPGEKRSAYNLAEADPVGIERFEIRGEPDDRTRTVTIWTTACHGHVYFEWSEDYPFIGDSSIC